MSDTLLATATTVKTGSACSAVINGVTTTVQAARDLTVGVGDVLVVMKVGAQWFALGRAYTGAPVDPINPPTPAVNPGTSSGVATFGPLETRSYRNGAWRTDNTGVYQGQYGGGGNHTGAVFYGSAPRSLAGATVTSATVQVRRDAGGAFAAQATTMRLMTESSKPAGAPTLTSTASGPFLAVNASTGGFALPNAWVQAMVNGTAGGIAFFDATGSPYVRFAGLGDWSPAFTISIRWTR